MTEKATTQHTRIVHDPAIMVGKPVVRGTRIPVERVIAHLAHNPDLADLLAAYPELTTEDVSEEKPSAMPPSQAEEKPKEGNE